MTKRYWLPKAPHYRAPATRAQWPVWVGVLTVCFLVVFFIGRIGSNSGLNVWDRPASHSRDVPDIRSVALESPLETAGDAVRRQALEAMRNSCDMSSAPTEQGVAEACAKP